MPLSPDQIREIYKNRRTKGLYNELLIDYMANGEAGVSVKEEWPQLADKQATTLKQGFENAKDRKEAPEGSENIDVIVDGENVYLINRNVADFSAEMAGAGAAAE